MKGNFARRRTTSFWLFAGNKEVGELSTAEQMQAAVLLTRLFECSSTVRSVFSKHESEKKDLYTQLRDLRTKVKQ